MIQLRWLEQADGSDVKKLQFRNWIGHYPHEGLWESWQDVPTEHYVKDTTESVSILPLAKE